MHESILSALLILAGFIILLGGGELLVRAASALAKAMRISPLVVGLTVVSFATSAPELAVTLQSAWAGAADLAVGNVVGSNIANVLLVLGAAALTAPLVVHRRAVRIDLPLVLAASVALWLLALDGGVGRVDGGLLFAALLVYLVWSIRQGRGEGAVADETTAPHSPWTLLGQLALLVLGLLLLAIGARLLVMGAVDIARVLGVDELVIGLTVVAIGTSLPEVATSVIACLRGHRDLAVGNVLGSNLFNILAVLGLGALAAPETIAISRQTLLVDLPIMIAVVLLCLPLFRGGMALGRRIGALFVGAFALYLAHVTLRATGASLLPVFELVVLSLSLPLLLWSGMVWRRGAGR
ncbi:calcium/sodium antiporter [Marichromatium sp. AB32]|uniref:calcium/sodium antiporter n=1 Tax=Marichromatium sp. AB32 TaxID=2483363 RepID=UPI000F3CBF8B|nr:calcium/sodium antiporter [Marichromatium sp. AB32]MBO8086401.1 calcium/sodium antiporter [Marichromatium sp.]RNE92460.1 sodium:calcium antiporter [Marichromatium sp. AB32]